MCTCVKAKEKETNQSLDKLTKTEKKILKKVPILTFEEGKIFLISPSSRYQLKLIIFTKVSRMHNYKIQTNKIIYKCFSFLFNFS